MNTTGQIERALLRLHRGAMEGQPVEPQDLARACALTLDGTMALLEALDAAELVDAARLRLTMAGLCVACSLRAAGVAAPSGAPERAA